MADRYEDCSGCEGQGGWLEGNAEEAPQDLAWIKCHECGGEGQLPVEKSAETLKTREQS